MKFSKKMDVSSLKKKLSDLSDRKNHKEPTKNGDKKRKKIAIKRDISIKIQLTIGFILPILFIIIVGTVAYTKASEGLTENYEESAATALEMLVETFDEATGQIQSTIVELAQDATVKAYSLGGYRDSIAQNEAGTIIRNNINVKVTAGSLGQNIHIIPKSEIDVITTQKMKTLQRPSIISNLAGTEDEALLKEARVQWGTKHYAVDKGLEIDSDSYVMFCSMRISSGDLKALAIMDIDKEAVMELLGGLDFGEGTMISLITPQGIEYACNHDIAMVETEFFKNSIGSEELYSDYITYDGERYLYLMCESKKTGAYITVMLPEENILASAKGIRNITSVLIVVACLIAVICAYMIISNITGNIHRSVKDLDQVSKGELYLKEKKQSNNEFGQLQGALTNTVAKMRDLVFTVKHMIEEVSVSGESVNESSKDVNDMVTNMGDKVNDILSMIRQEGDEVINCNEKMEMLSVDIKTVSSSIASAIEEVDSSKKIIADGLQVVEDMTRQSNETTIVTDEVQKQVLLLSDKLKDITEAVENIQEIASQTNLLSLNASIEAARAGEHGRGFSVVAEEIRKLADDSASMAVSIQKTIEEVQSYSKSTIDKVKKAEDIVAMQGESANNTANAFQNINSFMEKLTGNMQLVNEDVAEMNQKRKDVLHSIHIINRLSEEAVQTAQGVGEALENQVKSANNLTGEAGKLQENMKELEVAISSFKLEQE